jgi:hypothetical protein
MGLRFDMVDDNEPTALSLKEVGSSEDVEED